MSGNGSNAVYTSSNVAGPSFRWGNTATLVTATLSFLLLISLISRDVAAAIVQISLEVVGGLALLAYIIITVSYLRLNLLKFILRNRSWAYHPMSPFTRLYLGISILNRLTPCKGLCGVLGGKNPTLWKLQPCLPPLPVPDFEKTLQAYLDSVQPILTPEEFQQTKKVVAEFGKKAGIGESLHHLLLQRAKTEKTSWLLEWWENFVYLKSRYPLPVYSNWYFQMCEFDS